MKNALIINGGENTTNRDQIGEFDFIVAVDSGAEHAYKLFLKPDLIIGDLDSIDKKIYDRVTKDKIEIIEYKVDKDYTDFEIALKHVINMEIKDITVIGGEYGDIDHLFGSLFTINKLHKDQNILWIHGEQNILFPNSENIEIGVNKNFSVLPFSDLINLTISGAEWNLENENIRKLNLNESLPSDISSLNIVVLIKTKKNNANNNLPLFGISDHIFKTFDDRPNLLTKREIRVQILAALELPRNGVSWDIGAGCGSIGLEALKLRPNLDLFCFDKRIGSKELILENSKRLDVKPKFIFEEDINYTLNTRNLSSFENPNRLIIGGCDKKTKLQIINKLAQDMDIGDIIVIPIINIQTIKELKEELENKNFKTNLNLIQTYKNLSIARGMRLEPNNPIFLLKGKK